MSDEPDGFIEVTIRGKFPVYLNAYDHEDGVDSVQDVAELESRLLDGETTSVWDYVEMIDINDVEFKAVSNG